MSRHGYKDEDLYEVSIDSMVVVETGTYNDNFLRPYKSGFNAKTHRLFDEYTNSGRNVSRSTLAGIAGQIITPSSEASEKVDVANGWDTRRLRFFIRASCGLKGDLGAPTIEFITGFTDYADLTIDGKIDPNCRLYFNNSVIARQSVVRRDGVRQNQLHIVDASHVLVSPDVTGDRRSYDRYDQRANIELCTPMDVFGAMVRHEYPEDEVHDRRNVFHRDTVRKSRRSNGLATSFLDRTIKGVQQAERLQAGGNDFVGEDETIWTSARDQVSEALFTDDRFLSWLDDNTSYGQDRYITYRDLLTAFPGLENYVEVALLTTPQRKSLSERGDSEYWDNSLPETVVASVLGFSVPAIMMDLMLGRLSFMITNETLDGQPDIEIRNFRSLAGNELDVTPYVESAESRILTEVFPDISHHNNISLTIVMNVDVLGDTNMTISYNGGPDTRYTMPSFADGLFAPIISPMDGTLDDLASSIICLTEKEEMNDDDTYKPRNRRDRNERSNRDSGRI